MRPLVFWRMSLNICVVYLRRWLKGAVHVHDYVITCQLFSSVVHAAELWYLKCVNVEYNEYVSQFFFLIELSSETTMVCRTTISVKNIYELFFFLPVRLCLCRPSTTSRYSSSSTTRWSWWKRRRPKSGLKGKDTVNILNLARSIIYGKFFFQQLCIDLI